MLDESDNVEPLRVLELYSGIGGMHWALKESGISFEVVMAVDINTTANMIYQHNFPVVNLNSFGIEKLTLKKLVSLRPDAILMSPPCQPFSRVGKKGDCDDIRTKSFLHILQLLQQVDKKPSYILVENVKGFEVSRTRQMLLDTLQASDYGYQEYLLTPLQFGIPNSRLRYYMIAKLKSLPHTLVESSEIFYSLPDSSAHLGLHSDNTTSSSPSQSCHHTDNTQTANSTQQLKNDKFVSPCDTEHNVICKGSSGNFSSDKSNALNKSECHLSPLRDQDYLHREGDICKNCRKFNSNYGDTISGDTAEPEDETISDIPTEISELLNAGRNMRYCEESDPLIDKNSQPLSDYMESKLDDEAFEDLLVPDKDLRQFVVMDIVLPQLKKSTCFTKRYGHYVEGAGSLIQMSSSTQDTLAASCFKSKAVELKNKHDWGEEELSILRKLKLRYFSPREVANLLCFPADFEFPGCVSDIQKYRCLGNSLNVHVVALLIRRLTLVHSR